MADNRDWSTMQILTVVSIALTLYLIFRSAATPQPASAVANPKQKVPPNAARCNLQPECCQSVIAATCAIPLAADHLCCGVQGQHMVPLVTHGATSPVNRGYPVNTVAFAEAQSCCAPNSTSEALSMCTPVALPPQPKIDTCIRRSLRRA
jgi:hypothetical protein